MYVIYCFMHVSIFLLLRRRASEVFWVVFVTVQFTSYSYSRNLYHVRFRDLTRIFTIATIEISGGKKIYKCLLGLVFFKEIMISILQSWSCHKRWVVFCAVRTPIRNQALDDFSIILNWSITFEFIFFWKAKRAFKLSVCRCWSFIFLCS